MADDSHFDPLEGYTPEDIERIKTVDFQELLDRSSFGTPGVQALIERTPLKQVRRILDRADELDREERGEPPFILQKRGASCTLVALCNALRFFGKDSPEMYTDEFNYYRRIGGGMWGPIAKPVDAAEAMGLSLEVFETRTDANLPYPCILTCPCPEGFFMHSVLALREGMHDDVQLVNYRWVKGPVLETVSWTELGRKSMHPVHRKCWKVRLADDYSGSDQDR